jgi:hypothetical protein
MKNRALNLIAGTAMFTSSALAQVHVMAGPEPQMFEFKTLSSESFGGKVITGMPFSADESTATTQTLMDGNRIVNTSKSKVYRDQQGRTRTENTLENIGGLPASEARVSISINDPVAGVHYMLNPNERTAIKMSTSPQVSEDATKEMKMKLEAETKARTVQAEPFGISSGNATFVYSSRRSPERAAKTEELGNQNMEGVQVKGTRSTMTIPAGSMGNDRDINVVTERWYSPELQMNIMTKRTDPRMGETVFQVTNLNRSTPDASLFAPPADYQIKEGAKAMGFSKTVTIQK